MKCIIFSVIWSKLCIWTYCSDATRIQSDLPSSCSVRSESTWAALYHKDTLFGSALFCPSLESVCENDDDSQQKKQDRLCDRFYWLLSTLTADSHPSPEVSLMSKLMRHSLIEKQCLISCTSSHPSNTARRIEKSPCHIIGISLILLIFSTFFRSWASSISSEVTDIVASCNEEVS